MLGGELAVLQAPMFDGLSLDPFAQFDDCRSPAEVGVGRRHVGQALVVSLVIVVLDEGLDVGFEVAGQEVVFSALAMRSIRPAGSPRSAWQPRGPRSPARKRPRAGSKA